MNVRTKTTRLRTESATAIALALAVVMCGAREAAAQQAQDPASAAAPAQPAEEPSDRAVDPSQPDFTLIGLPTNLRMPKFASAFRVTHRFLRPLGQGDFVDLAGDGFGIDGSAQIGLEYRFGIWSGAQIGIHRTSDRTIQLFGQYQLLRQRGSSPVTLDVLATAEGANNLRDHYSPAIGAVVSRTLGRRGAVYFQPIWVNNSNQLPSGGGDENDTFVTGFGARLRVLPSVYIIGEAAPRFGYTPSSTYVSFAIEKRYGGHSFQVNVGNGFGSTLAQIARGGFGNDTWFLGFNISRKFF
jgi:hypothetical protein